MIDNTREDEEFEEGPIGVFITTVEDLLAHLEEDDELQAKKDALFQACEEYFTVDSTPLNDTDLVEQLYTIYHGKL